MLVSHSEVGDGGECAGQLVSERATIRRRRLDDELLRVSVVTHVVGVGQRRSVVHVLEESSCTIAKAAIQSIWLIESALPGKILQYYSAIFKNNLSVCLFNVSVSPHSPVWGFPAIDFV